MFGIPLAMVLIPAIAMMFLFIFGACRWCEKFVNEYEHGQFEGGFKYVADQEHDDATGEPLTGRALEVSRRMEQIFNPLCYPLNKLRGIEKAPPA